jgi:Ca-activated chloride channel family protein
MTGILCGVALALAMDVSGSMDTREYELVTEGYGAALRDPRTASAVRSAPHGRIAIALTHWASDQAIVIGWTVIGPDDLPAIAELVEAAPRSVEPGSTNLDAAIVHAVALMASAPCGDRQVIDVSGDGEHNVGTYGQGRYLAEARGITINGLPIVSHSSPDLTEWYREHVQTGFGSFTRPAHGYDDVGMAMLSKLVQEVAGVPATLAEARQ